MDLLPERNQLASLPAFLFLVVILVIHLTLGSFVQVANPAFGIAFDELFVFAGLTVLFVRAMNFQPAPFLALRAPAAGAWPWAIVTAIAGFFAAGAINALNQLLVGPEMAGRFDITPLFDVRSPLEGALLVVGVALLAPLGEELLFRGYLMRVFKARHGKGVALFLTSALFAIVHFNPASLFALFSLGVVFGLLRLWTGSIWPAILAHAVQNGAASALVLTGLAAQSPDELPAGDALLLLAFSLPFLLGALSLLRRGRPTREDEHEEDASLPALDPERSHRLSLGLVLRPLLLGIGLAAAAIAMLFVVDGESASARLERNFKKSPPVRSNTDQPDAPKIPD